MMARGCSFTHSGASFSDEQERPRFDDTNTELLLTHKSSDLMRVIIASSFIIICDADLTTTATRSQCLS